MTGPAQSGSFDEYAHDYDRLLDDPLRKRFAGDNAFFIRQKCRAMLRTLERDMPVDRRWRVLDAGCGQGAAFEFLRGSCDVVGADVSIPMLRVAAQQGAVVAQEPFDLPFRAGGFDAAFAFCVYHHIAPADRVRHLRELARVVRPGGFVFVFEHNPLNPVTRRVFNRAPIDRGCQMIPSGQLRGTFRNAGLRDVEQGYLLFVPESLERTFGFLEPHLQWLPFGGQYYVCGRTAI
jgi:SAM-dependent methyltransferase